jgi:hypothetical protein
MCYAMVQKPWLYNSTWHNLKMSGNRSEEYKSGEMWNSANAGYLEAVTILCTL